MKKIGHIFKTYFPETQGGMEEVIRQIALHTSPMGWEHHVFTVSQQGVRDDLQLEKTHIHRYPATLTLAKTPISLRYLLAFANFTKDMDILHFHYPWPFGDACYTMNFWCKKPSLVTYQADIIKQVKLKKIYLPFMKRFLNKVDVIVPTSENYLRTSNDLIPYRSKCAIIPNFMGENRFPAIDKTHLEQVWKRFGEQFFLFVGVLRLYKGLTFLLDAMVGIKTPLLIIGKGPEEKALKEQANRLKLKNVHFLGYIPDTELPSYYTLCKGLVFPSLSRQEAYGMTILEALMFNKPVISTELGSGTSWLNTDQLTGLVVPTMNSAALHQAMQFFIDHPEQLLIFGKNARQHYETFFTAEVNASKYDAVYRQLLGVR